jgi:putative flippase GtrA
VNGGKGHALKEGLKYILSVMPDVSGVVTADGDGQHAYRDILKVRDALAASPSSLVMGVRDFKGPNVPRHNKIGNRLSSAYFRLVTHKKLQDTQTGLRGVPASLLPLALGVYGSRYEYEMNFLFEAVKEAPLVTVGIETIYDGNKDSHFHPIRDSFRIYRTPILYVAVALLSVAIDEGLFYLLSKTLPSSLATGLIVLIATVTSRLVSGTFNFLANDFWVFKNEGGFARKLAKYLVVYIVNMGLSFGLVWAFSFLPSELVFIKIVVDFILFVANYFVEMTWVFARKRHHGKETDSLPNVSHQENRGFNK